MIKHMSTMTHPFTPWRSATAAAALLCALLAGCGSTPQAALDQANHGAALTAALEAELRTLRSVQSDVAKARLDSIRRLNTSRATVDAEGAFDQRVQEEAYKPAHAQLTKALKALGDSRAKDEQTLQDALDKADQTYAQLLSPQPDPSGKLQATQQALMALSDQLTVRERLTLSASFAKTVRQAIKNVQAQVAAPQKGE